MSKTYPRERKPRVRGSVARLLIQRFRPSEDEKLEALIWRRA